MKSANAYKVTMKEIADMAGMSVMTVSRVLAGKECCKEMRVFAKYAWAVACNEPFQHHRRSDSKYSPRIFSHNSKRHRGRPFSVRIQHVPMLFPRQP